MSTRSTQELRLRFGSCYSMARTSYIHLRASSSTASVIAEAAPFAASSVQERTTLDKTAFIFVTVKSHFGLRINKTQYN
jgi:hypothetical protein